jgi:hypothetical protein
VVAAEYLRRADIVLLLISVNFLSPECYDRYHAELQLAYERQKRGQVKIVPVILKECDWQSDVLEKLNPLPRGGVPVGSPRWESPDRAFREVVQELRALADELLGGRRPPAPPSPVQPAERPASVQTAGSTEPGEPAGPPTPPEPADRPGPSHAEGLIARLLEILSTGRPETAMAEFRLIAHRSLFAQGELEPGFRRNNLVPAFGRAARYHRPPVIVGQRPTGRRYLGVRDDREVGREVNFSIARCDDAGGMAGHVRLFFPQGGGAPTVSDLSL